MKIGIDVRPLCFSITGIGRYLLEVINALSRRPDVQLILYTPYVLPIHLNLTNVAVRVIKPPRFFPSSINSIWWVLVTLPRALKKDQLDVFWSARHRLPFLSRFKKLSLVLSINDIVVYKYPKTMAWKNWLLERSFLIASAKKADHIIAISNATKRDLVAQLKLPVDKISVIHLAQTSSNEPTASLPELGTGFIFFLGSIEPRKNVGRLLDAYLQLPLLVQQQHPLVLAGGRGWKSAELHQRIAELSQTHSVKYIGYIEDSIAFDLLTRALVLVYPSLYEGFGLPIIEAMQVGTPVITSTDAACQEVGGTAALYVDPYDTAALTQALMRVINEPALRLDLHNKGLQRATQFSWQKTADAHLELFKKITHS